jgi:hypothetical protein
MGRPKGSKNKPKNVEVEVETKQEEVKVVASAEPKKERKPRITKRVKKEEDDDDNTVVDEGALEARKNLDDRTLDPYATTTTEQFECEFMPLTERLTPIDEKSEIKNGRYSSSYYPIKNCNMSVWPVLAYIKADVDALRERGYTDKVIYAGCINYLSSQMKGKKRKYGNLFPFSFAIKPDKIIATFVTDIRKSPEFWGEGIGV